MMKRKFQISLFGILGIISTTAFVVAMTFALVDNYKKRQLEEYISISEFISAMEGSGENISIDSTYKHGDTTFFFNKGKYVGKSITKMQKKNINTER